MTAQARKITNHLAANISENSQIDAFLAQHLALATGEVDMPHGRSGVTLDEAESPLVWLARRKGRDGRPLIDGYQLAAGERLRSEFTRAQMMPRVTSNWQAAVSTGARSAGGGAGHMTEVVIAARQRFRQCGGTGVRRLACRCLLFSQAPRGRRARASVAGAQRQGGASTRT